MKFRLRLRALMIVVAVLAIGLYAKINYDWCMDRAEWYWARARHYRAIADVYTRMINRPEVPAPPEAPQFEIIDTYPGIRRKPTPPAKTGPQTRPRAKVKLVGTEKKIATLEQAEAAFRRAAWLFFLPRPADPEEFRSELQAYADYQNEKSPAQP